MAQEQHIMQIQGALDIAAMKLLVNCASGLLSGVGPLSPEQYLNQIMNDAGYHDNGIVKVRTVDLQYDHHFGLQLKVSFIFKADDDRQDNGNFYINAYHGMLGGDF